MSRIPKAGVLSWSCLLAVCAFGAVCPVWSETGMALVSCFTTGYADWKAGQIRRIDLENDVVVRTTAVLGTGIGHHMRFNPRGDQFAYLVGDGNSNTVQISNLDGGAIRSFTASNTDGVGYVSWTNSGIWVSGNQNLVLYDTLGIRIRNYEGQGLAAYETYVSQNDRRGACVENYGNWYPTVFSLERGTSIRLTPPAGATEGGCSVCPSPDGTLITNNLVQNSAGPTGAVIDWHKSMRIVDTLGAQKYYLLLQNATKFPADGYRWNTQAWSGNSNDWILIPVGEDNGTWVPDANLSACIYNIRTQQKVCLADNSGKRQWWMIYDYYSGKIPGSTTASLQLSPATLDFAADSGSTNPLSQTVTATTATGTMSGVTVTGLPAWLTATPSATSGATITVTNTALVAGKAVGVYKDTITVSSSNAGAKTYIVTFTVRRPAAQSVLTSVLVTPQLFTVVTGGNITFLATPRDQTGAIMKNVTTTWTASGGGTISANGVYTAGNAIGGRYRIVATSVGGSVTMKDTALLLVSNTSVTHRKIDCGPNTNATAGWETDDALVSGGRDWTNPGTVTTTNVAAAAPAAVYKGVRRGGSHTYTIPNLPAAMYTVRLHLADAVDSARNTSYTIQGVNVASGLSVSTSAGGINKALVMDFSADLTSGGNLTIMCSGTDAIEGGIEIIENTGLYVTLVSPNGGERYTVGQTVPIVWYGDTSINEVDGMLIYLSPNGGLTWWPIASLDGIWVADANWGNYQWTIPATLTMTTSSGPVSISTVGTQCQVQIVPRYPGMVVVPSYSASYFTINGGAPVVTDRMAPPAYYGNAVAGYQGLTVAVNSRSSHVVTVSTMNGATVLRTSGQGRATYAVPRDAMSAGTYVVSMRVDGKVTTKTIVAGK